MASNMPFHPVLEAFGGNLKIVGTGARTANQHMPHFADDVRGIGDEIATELRTNLLQAGETQSFSNGDWVRLGLCEFLDVRTHACSPTSHPLCTGQ